MSHPAQLPDVFLDRSLGRVKVPGLLRAAGLRVITLAEHYGVPRDQTVDDITWLTETAARGWVVFMKDANIRRVPAEREAVRRAGARCFCLTSAQLSAGEMARRFVDGIDRIAEACESPGPFIYAVHERRIERLHLRER